MKQAILLATEDRRIIKTKIQQFGEWLYDSNRGHAWYTLRRYFSKMPMLGKGVGLALDERFALPLNPYADYTPAELSKLTNVDDRSDEAINLVAARAERDSAQNVVAWSASIIAMSFTLIVVIFGILIAAGAC